MHYLGDYSAYNYWNYEPGDIHRKADEGSGQQSEEKIVGVGWNVIHRKVSSCWWITRVVRGMFRFVSWITGGKEDFLVNLRF